MASPGFSNVLTLYQRTLSVGALEYFQKQADLKIRRGVYCAQVVLWMMILQRLHAVGTLSSTVQLLLHGAAGPLLQNCRRVRRWRISARTGGYCQARQKLPAVLCRQVNREITEQLRQLLVSEDPGVPRAYLLDGSSLELEHSPELVRNYPPARNQHGSSHWPILRIGVLHELETGLAEEPQWGPMYGTEAVSEQQLAEQAINRLPAQAVIVGDRNFGVLWVAHAAQQRNLQVVLRVTEVRARKLVGAPISSKPEHQVTWKASRLDGGKHRRVPATAAVEGRLISIGMGRGKSKKWLHLFTTLDWPAEKIASLYGLRWNIETDLRSLKRTVRLHHMTAKSNDMLEKELHMAVCAYNLVRAVMTLAARQSNINPRQLSFAMVLNVVDCAWHKLVSASSPQAFDREFANVLRIARQCTLPKRKKRSYPRQLWRRQPGFPFRKGEN
jgi:putative transposase